VATSILLNRTRFGRYVFAIGGNEEAARLAGINVGRVKTLVYVISGAARRSWVSVHGALLVGIAANRNGRRAARVDRSGGRRRTSLAGGRGSIVGTFFGALLIGVLYNAMNLLNVDSYLQKVLLGAVILLAVVLDELRKRYLTQ